MTNERSDQPAPLRMRQFRLGSRQVDLSRRRVDDVPLTEQEALLLQVLAEAGGDTVGKEVLYRRVWGYRGVPRGRALDFAVRRLRTKLEHDPTRPSLLLTVRGTGFRLSIEGIPAMVERSPVPSEPPSSLIGRDAELQTLCRSIAASRVVTILGPGGVGKTRLVRRWFASRSEDEWPGGQVWLSLDGTGDDSLLSTLADAIAPGRGEPRHRLRAALRGPRGLLVLDEAEAVAVPLGALLDSFEGDWRFVVTSRVRLRAEAEQVVDLKPLSPEHALALLEQRARAVRASFAVDSSNRASAEALVRVLDGLPLALELAAPRLRMFSAADLLMRLEQGTDVLASADESLSEAIGCSWKLLSDKHQQALAACALFDSPFPLDAAEAVLAPMGDPLLLLDTLIDHSLLHVEEFEDGPMFRLLTTVSQWVRGAADPLPACVDAFVTHYVSLFGQSPRLEVASHDGGWIRRRVGRELSSMRGAARRASREETGALWLGIVIALRDLGRIDAAYAVADEGVHSLPRWAAHLLSVQARIEWSSGDGVAAAKLLERATKLGTGNHAEPWVARAWAMFHVASGDKEAAKTSLSAGLLSAQRWGDMNAQASLLTLQVQMLTDAGEFDHAQQAGDEAREIYRRIGSLSGELVCSSRLAVLALQRSDIVGAVAMFDRAITLARLADNRQQLVGALRNRATLGLMLDDTSAEDQLREALGLLLPRQLEERAFVLVNLANAACERGVLDEAERTVNSALELLDGLAAERVRIVALVTRCMVKVRQGVPEMELAKELIRSAHRSGAGMLEVMGKAMLARAQTRVGAHALARGLVDDAWASSDNFGDTQERVFVVSTRAVCAAARKDRDDATVALRELTDLSERMVMFPQVSRELSRTRELVVPLLESSPS